MEKKKVALVTGASSGFGYRTAVSLAGNGYEVYGTSRKQSTGVSAEGIYMLVMDVRDRRSVRQAVENVINAAGRIDLLVNNAGVGISGSLEMTSEADMHLQMETNFYGMANVTSEVLHYMRKQRSGLIINISSIAGRIAVPYQGFYSASKFAIEGYSEALAVEVKRFGIKVAMVEPGDFNTGFTDRRKVSAETEAEKDYSSEFSLVMVEVENSERNGPSPDLVARAIVRLAGMKNPPFRTLVGPASQCFLARIRKFLPDRFVQYALRKFYGML